MAREEKRSELISIIIPVYNDEKNIGKCLSCIQAQTIHNFEVIIVDDGSSDRTAEVCKKYLSNNNFYLYTVERKGASEARNFGISKSKGDYICFCDSDDYYDPDFCEILYSSIKSVNADISYCDFKVNQKPEGALSHKILHSTEEVMAEYANGGMYNRIMNKMYRKNVIDGISFNRDRVFMEDAAWTANVLKNVGVAVCTGTANYNYVIRSGSLQHKKHTEKEIVGSWANQMEKISILHEYSSSRQAALDFYIDLLKQMMLSNYDLSLFNLYAGMVALGKSLEKGTDLKWSKEGQYIASLLQSDMDVHKNCRKYKLHALISKNFSIKTKAAILYRALKTQ